MPGRLAPLPSLRTVLVLLAIALLGPSRAAIAQAPAEPITPPSLVEAAEAVLPPGLEAVAIGAEVELVLVVDEQGRVTEAVVPSPIGHGLDEVAVDAMLRSRFRPAFRGDTPVPVRIRFRYVFTPPPETPDAPQPPLPGRFAGTLRTALGEPVVDALVIVFPADGIEREARSDDGGAFAFDDVPAGPVHLEAIAADGAHAELDEQVRAGEETHVVLALAAPESTPDGDVLEARAVVDPPPREVTRRTLPREVLARVPGTRGDALRTLELMPGVARPPFGAGMLIVRGGSPADSEIQLDGVPVPLLYHFGGITSFIPTRLLERIDFYPGNFSSRYGRRTGGMVDVATRDPATDRLHSITEVSAIDVGTILEGPIGRRASFVLAARRSVIDLLFGSMLDGGAVRFTSAPVYYDYQAFFTIRPTDRDRIRIQLYGASDSLRLLFEDEGSDSPEIQGRARAAIRFNHLQASWDRRLGERAEQRVVLQVGPTRIDQAFGGAIRLDARLLQTFGRAEWIAPLGTRLRLVAGVDVLTVPYDFVYRGPAPTPSEGSTGEGSTDVEGVDARGTGTVARPGAYVDLGVALGPLYLNFGQRIDYFAEIGRVTFDPRLAARLEASEHVRVRGGVGLYSQAPEYPESIEGLGNPDLHAIRSLHGSLGVDVLPAPGIELGLDGFAKYLWDRVVPTEDGEAPRFRSAGTGRIYGAELSARANPTHGPWFGYLSYTLMRSERLDPGQTRYRLFDFDQTHILTASFGVRLPRHWEIGGTFRYASGNPYTRYVGSVHDLSRPRYIPVSDEVNGARSDAFHRLDLRVEKQWWFDRYRLAFFVDVQNAYNRANPEGRAYSYDYRESTTLRGLPILPSIGLRGEL